MLSAIHDVIDRPVDAGETAAAIPSHAPANAVVALMTIVVAGIVGAIVLTPKHLPPTSPAKHLARTRAISASVMPAPPQLTEPTRVLDLPPETARELNARRPVLDGPVPAAMPYRFFGNLEDRRRAADCLAAAGWYEAGDDPNGQRAVMQVVLNRVRHPAFAHSVCGVVFQGSDRTTGCQFTFTCDGSMLRRRPVDSAWQRARTTAMSALSGKIDPQVGYATHYHAEYVVPYWAPEGDKIAQLGLHIFYRWHGFWGTRAAFTREPLREEPKIAALAGLSTDHAGAVPIPATAIAAGGTGAMAMPSRAVAALPAPVQVAGVREKSMRNALVRAERDGEYFIQLDPAIFPGNYATAAVALCKDKPACAVFGWTDPAHMGLVKPFTSSQRDSLSFYYRHGSDGSDEARWNCRQFPRGNQAQCLTGGSTASLP